MSKKKEIKKIKKEAKKKVIPKKDPNELVKEPKKKPGIALWIGISTGILFFLFLIGLLVFYIIFQSSLKKEAVSQLKARNYAYKEVVENINDLKTEEKVGRQQEISDWEPFKKQAQNELEKINKVQESIIKAKEIKRTENKYLEGVDQELTEFYTKLEETLDKYQETYVFLERKISISVDNKEGVQEMSNVFTLLFSDQDIKDEDFIEGVKKGKESTENYITELKKIETPEGLLQYKNREITESQELVNILGEIIKSYDERDEDGLYQALTKFSKLIEDQMRRTEKEKFFEIYQDEIDEEFGKRNKEADRLKEVFIAKKTQLETPLDLVQIENW